MIVESPTTHSNLDGPISAKFHTRILLRCPAIKARERSFRRKVSYLMRSCFINDDMRFLKRFLLRSSRNAIR
jgi:hypothetical protein